MNHNLEARRRNVRFGLRRRWCRAWVQVEYGDAITFSPLTTKPPPFLSEGGAAAGAGREQSSSSYNARGSEAHNRGSTDSESDDRQWAGGKRTRAVVTVEDMSGATRPSDEERNPVLERGGTGAAVGSGGEPLSASLQR